MTASPIVAGLWQRLAADLRRYFVHHAPPGVDPEDLLQECFLRVQQGLERVRDEDRLGSYVFRVASNLVIDAYRSKPAPTTTEEAVEPDGDDAQKRLARCLEPFFDEIPEHYAEVLRRSELDGEPHRTIAADLALSVSAIKSRVKRGRELLRGRLLACCRFEFDRRGRVADYVCHDRYNGDGCGGDDVSDTKTTVWVCQACGLIYDPAIGMPEDGIPPGTPFEDIPDDWVCPQCGVSKSAFSPM